MSIFRKWDGETWFCLPHTFTTIYFLLILFLFVHVPCSLYKTTYSLQGSTWWVYFTSVAMSRFQCLVPSRLACLTAYLACSFHSNQQKVRQNRVIIESQRLLRSKINIGYRRLYLLSMHRNFYIHTGMVIEKGPLKIYESTWDHHQCGGRRTDYMTYGVVFPALGLHDKSPLNRIKMGSLKAKWNICH